MKYVYGQPGHYVQVIQGVLDQMGLQPAKRMGDQGLHLVNPVDQMGLQPTTRMIELGLYILNPCGPIWSAFSRPTRT